MLRVCLGVLQIFLLLVLSSPATIAEESDRLRDTSRSELLVPVAFATDRCRSNDHSLQQWFGKQSVDDTGSLSYGVIEKSTVINDFPKALISGSEPNNFFATPPLFTPGTCDRKGKDRLNELTLESLFQTLRNSNRPNRIVVYVHGCCMSFAASASEAALLSAWIQQPVIMYDWGSPPASYAGSLVSYPRSQARFNLFIDKLSHEFPDSKISLVAFSLGAQLITDYLLQSSNDSRRIANVVLAKPDVDLVAFKSRLDKLLARAERIHVLSAKNDWALALSGALRRLSSPSCDSTRLGAVEAALAGTGSVQILEISQLGINHVLPCPLIAEVLNCGGNCLGSDRYAFKSCGDGLTEVSWR